MRCVRVASRAFLDDATQVVGDLVELCRVLKPHVLDIIENVADEGCLNLALTVHDELTRVLQSYDKILTDESKSAQPKKHSPLSSACHQRCWFAAMSRKRVSS